MISMRVRTTHDKCFIKLNCAYISVFSHHDHIYFLDRLGPAHLSVTLRAVVHGVLGVVHNQRDVEAADQAELRGQELQQGYYKY